MAETTSDILIETLHAWGVDTIFGLPGDGINGIMEALRRRQAVAIPNSRPASRWCATG